MIGRITKRLFNFQYLITNETRQEFLTSVVLALITIADLIFLLVVLIYCLMTGDDSGLPYFGTLGILSAIGWYLSRVGRWRWARRLPTVLFFILGTYGSVQDGFSTLFIAFYIIAFMLSGLLVNKVEMLLIALTALVTHTLFNWPNIRVEGLIVLAAQFTGICLIQWIYITISDNIFEHSLLDPLTQVYNRSYFQATLAILQKSRKYPISIVVIDMDGLKKTNDTLGHIHGDRMLVRASQCLRSACRSEDAISRIGGDEFGLILTRTDQKEVAGVVERIANLVDANNKEFSQMPLSLSIGVATAARPKHSLQDTFKLADQRMYAEKHAKRTSL